MLAARGPRVAEGLQEEKREGEGRGVGSRDLLRGSVS